MMNRKQNQRIGTLLCGGLAAFSVGVAGWSVAWPVQSPKSDNRPSSMQALAATVAGVSSNMAADSTATMEKATSRTTASLSGKGTHWYRKLRLEALNAKSNDMHLDDAAETMLPEASDKGPRLIGTILEQGHSFAMIIDKQGTIDLQPEGGVLQIDPTGMRVEQIFSDSVVISHNGKRETLLISLASMFEDQADEDVETQDEPASREAMSLEEELDWLNGSPGMQSPVDSNEQNGRP